MNYTTSIINKYGDMAEVRSDLKTLNDIIARQGTDLLIDAIAEYVGNTAIKFSLSDNDRMNLMKSLVDGLQQAILERI